MRLLLPALALILAAPLAAAQDGSVLVQDAPVEDGLVLIAVPTDALPEGFLDDLPAIPEGATLLNTPEEAVAELAYRLPESVLAEPKDETFGLLFSILIPGGGHIYAGETNKGLTLLAVGLGGAIGGSLLSGITGSTAPALLGIAAYLGAWVYGILDGQKAVERYNAANGFAVVPSAVEAGGVVGPGLSAQVRF